MVLKNRINTAKKPVTKQGVLINIRLAEQFLDRIDKFCEEHGVVRSVMIRRAVERFMAEATEPKGEISFTEKEKQKIVSSALRLDEALDRQLTKIVNERRDLLTNLDDKSVAQLVISRIPKAGVGDGEFNNDVLELRECLKALPSDRNWSHALSAERLENDEIMARLRILEKKVAVYEKNDGVVSDDLLDFCRTVFEESLRFVGEMVALRELPGYANGKCCLSERQRELSDKSVLKAVEHMLMRKRDYNTSKGITAEILGGSDE